MGSRTIPNDGFGGQDVIANVQHVNVMSYLNDVVYGDGQDNRIRCGDGSDTIYGGDGNDEIATNFGSGLLSGGAGDDKLFTASADVTMDGGTGRNTYEYNIVGGRAETIISGEPTDPGGAGRRTPDFRLYAGHGGFYVTLYGTNQDDVITIEPGSSPGEIIVMGVAGMMDGTKFVNIGGVTVFAGAGNDTISINMVSVDAEPAQWPTIYGDQDNDLLIAQCRAELVGGIGDDTLVGRAEDDKLSPGGGNDSVDGGGGRDTLYIDVTSAYYTIGVPTTRAIVRLDQGTVPADGLLGHDTLSGIEAVSVDSPYQDEICGDAGDNLIIVSGGDDLVYARGRQRHAHRPAGTHHLFGEEGNDVFFAGDSSNPNNIDGGPGYASSATVGTFPGSSRTTPGNMRTYRLQAMRT